MSRNGLQNGVEGGAALLCRRTQGCPLPLATKIYSTLGSGPPLPVRHLGTYVSCQPGPLISLTLLERPCYYGGRLWVQLAARELAQSP